MNRTGSANAIRVLLVEDGPGDARLIREMLRGEAEPPFTLSHVDRLDRALAEIAAQVPDAVLLDLGLPDSGGLETLEQVQQVLTEAPVIVISGLQDEEVALAAVRSGAQDYLMKARLDGELLTRVIRHAIERHRAEARLRWLTMAVEQSPSSVMITEPSGRIVYVNPQFTTSTGYAASEAIGQYPRLLKSGLTAPEVYDELWRTILAGKVWRGELQNRRKSGELTWEALLIAPLHDSRHRITHFLGIQEDISAARRMQEQLLHSQRMESVGRLAGGVAHDFNNLLTVIFNNAEFALDGMPAEAPQRQDIEEIRRAAERAAALTRQLLSFARRQVVHPQVIALNALVLNLDRMLRRLIGEDVELVTLLAPSVWPVAADPHQVEQAVVNLVVNARDAMPSGGRLTIETANATLPPSGVPGAAQGDWVLLRVSDSGQGMSEEIRRQIFDPFFTTKPEGRGTGLGLATVHSIMTQASGHIEVSTEPGRGSSFTLYFPRASGQAEQAPAEDDVPVRGGTETILLVEDEPQVLLVAARTLSALGYTVLSAQNGIDALRIANDREIRIDLLLTDMVMPLMSGREVAAQALALRPGLPVLYTSGYAGQHIGGYDPGLDHHTFLAKPYLPADLARKVREAIGSAARGAAG